MPAFCVNASKPKQSLRFYTLHLIFFKTQVRNYNINNSKFGFNESQVLKLLSQRRLTKAHLLLDERSKRTSHGRVVYWTSLLTRYSKCGSVDEAETLFSMMPEKNVVSYNAMLCGYLGSGRLGDAMRLFEVMPEKNVISWTVMLSGFRDAGRIAEAKRLFEEMPEKNVVSWNVMVGLLIKNGELEDARRVFDCMTGKNVVSWNTMIAGYVESGQMKVARVLFEEMEDKNVITWTTMISGYCRVGEVEEGYHLFQRSPEKNVVSWTAMIGGFCWNGFYEEALRLFLEMKTNPDVRPNVETFISVTYACAGLGFLHLGKQVHAHLISSGLIYDGLIYGRLSKSLIYMYSLFGIMDSAHYLFSKNSNACTVQSSNYMIHGYIQIGQLAKAQVLFDATQERDKVTWTSMIEGYLKAGNVSRARILFNDMPNKDVVVWTAMISGHVQNELFAEAANFFSEMRALGFPPLSATCAVLFSAAGAMSYLDYGTQLHCLVIKSFSDCDLILYNSLISMYSKCGNIHGAHRIFSNMNLRDLISWNSMIMGFSHHGLADEALKVFKAMPESGNCPNPLTFLGILSACAHAGLVDQGWKLFKMMSDVYAIKQGMEHCICMVSLMGRAGNIKEAEDFILASPFEKNHAIWGTLLGVCGRGEENIDIAKRAARRLLELDPLNASAHVLLCNIYAANGQHVEEQMLRKEMGMKRVRKTPGCSWILVNGIVEVFLSGDKLWPQVEEMLLFLFKSDGGICRRHAENSNSGVPLY